VVRKFQTIKFPILNSSGEVTYTVGISHDITEAIEMKERSYAAAKMASLGEMAGAIAHEINNPIAIILGKSRHLKKYIDSQSYDKALMNIDSIEVHSYRIAKIIHNLLTFCRDDKTERFEMHLFSSILNQVLSFANETFKFHKIDLKLQIIDDVEVECLSVPISQVLLNLINNALDAATESDAPWIKIEVKKNGEFMECRVSDSGPGVPDEIAVKIMQPFFTTKPIGKGTGLGLSICQSIAIRHGGKLSLDRSVSRSCFLLRLPLKQRGSL
jgi:C4-dicarboxylate-specific signal transduction histidine kinase